MNKTTIRIGIIALLTLFAVHMAILPDYGLTWDFHFHFFAGANFFGLKPEDVEPRALPFVAPDPRISIHLPYGPFVQIVPFASWLLLYKNLNILPYDVAYNLPIVAAGVLGIGALYFFLAEAISGKVGLIAAIFLALTPRYFADIHNNMKDAPMAAVFALNMWMLWRLWRFRRVKDLLLAVFAFAIAFNTKINSIFIPAIFAAWLFFINIKELVLGIRSYVAYLRLARHCEEKIPHCHCERSEAISHDRLEQAPPSHIIKKIAAPSERSRNDTNCVSPVIGYFVLAPLAAFLLWWLFWGDAIGQLKLAAATFGWGADNIEVLLNGQWFCAGSTVPWYYPYWYLAITTPLPILLFFLIGLIRLIRRIRHIGLLLLLWLLLPLTRYLLPKIAVIDGVRHFEEVLYPMAAIAAVGAVGLARKFPKILISLIGLISLMSLIGNIVSYHPFQISYYNELVGGMKGAIGKYDIDYWGSSQKKAAEWLNKNAAPNSNVHIVMAADVAGLYLRPDLLARLNTVGQNEADYVVVLNRQSFFYRYYYLFDYLLRRKPAYVIENQGVPIVWIFNNRTPPIPRLTPWWKGEDPCIQKYWN